MAGSRRGRAGGLVFGGIFAAIGLGFLFFSIIPTLVEAWQVQSWQPVQADVLAAKLYYNRSSDGTTYRAGGRYRYRWQGREYTASRLGLSSGSDNIGDWHQQMVARLERAKEATQPITVWVNPAMPQEAIVDREVRWGLFAFKLVFVIVFGGVGIAIMVFVARRPPAMDPASPAPWLVNPAWRQNRIRAGGKGVVWFLWIFGLLWMAFMVPLLNSADRLSQEGLPFSLLPYLLPLIGVLVLLQALVKTLRRYRYGDAVLNLQPFPGEVGGRVAGQVAVKMDPRQGGEVEVRLSCIHVYWRRSGSKNERREEILWQDNHRVKPRPGPQGALIDFDFRPPAGLPVSSDGSSHHKWVVDLRARVRGPDLEQRFTIPVFDQHDEAASADGVSAAAARTPAAPPFDEKSLPRWLQPSWRRGGIELRLPMFRNISVALVLLIMGAIFAGVGAFLLQEGEAPRFFALIFALAGGGMLLGGVYAVGNSLQVRVTPRGVELVRRIYGIPLRRTVPSQAISRLESRIGVRTNNRAFYRVHMVTTEGKTYTLADTIPSASAADYLVEKLSEQLGLQGADTQERQYGGMIRPGKTPLASPEMLEKMRKIQRWVRVGIFVVFLLGFGSVALSIVL